MQKKRAKRNGMISVMSVAPCTPQAVLDFWRNAGPERWFAKDAAFDAEFKHRFEPAYRDAVAEHLDGWRSSPGGALALVILLDQFPRNAYRGSARMFASDSAAREIADAAVGAGFDRQVDPLLQRFFYLPFMHSEDPADQARSVEFNASQDEDTHRFARLHQTIVERFGRFPHRNGLLQRPSSNEERAFLEQGGFAG